MRSSNRFKVINLSYFRFYFFLSDFLYPKTNSTKAQLIPIPPPVQQPKSTPLDLEPSQAKNDTTISPTIEVLTTSLLEGGNVFRVKITDKSAIINAEITFVQNGQLVTQGLVRDPNNVYKTLIYAHLPSAVVVTSAFDVHGKTASVVKYLK